MPRLACMKFKLVITVYIVADYRFISHTVKVNDFANVKAFALFD